MDIINDKAVDKMLVTDQDTPIDLENTTTTAAAQVTNESLSPMNRKARRAAAKKMGRKGRKQVNDNMIASVSEVAKQLNYFDLIEKLKKLNEKIEMQGENNNENTDKAD